MVVAIILLATLVAGAATAAVEADREAAFARVFPDADSFGAPEGTPPAATAYRDGQVVGYAFLTRDVVGSNGFSGKPLDIAIGLDLDGRITGAEIVEHHEPILVIGVTDADLAAFVAQYRGLDIRDRVSLEDEPGVRRIDAVSGATVSSVVMNDAVLRAARAVARSRGLLGDAAAALDLDSFAPASWDELLAEGALARLRLSNATVDAALARVGGGAYGPPGMTRDPAATFIDLYVGLATPAAIGRNLLGERLHERLMASIRPDDQLLFVAARGLFSFKGTAWRKSGIFERIEIIQGDRALAPVKDWYRPVARVVAEGAPELRTAAIFVVPAGSGFDPTRPWRLELLVPGESDQGVVYARFALPYRPPARLLAPAAETAPSPAPLWLGIWKRDAGRVAVVVVALMALTLILVFEDAIVRRRQVYYWVRYGFLAFTLLWLGWYAGAQLSLINVITFAQALLSGFRWDIFLVAPLIFVLWSYVALTLLFWGRGVFCGWLCPFGALQEIVNRLARLLRIPQISLPFVVHERLWMIKYVVFIGLFALAFGDYDRVQPLIEVEPFKTAIVLRFDRAWPFVAYALALLAVGLFIERAYCRYLCPLGAALAIPARLRMFEWLKRKWQCGSQCQICAKRCTVQAIHPDGHINPNECIHCLNCQVLYYDDRSCPPLIERRKRRERARRAMEAAS